ncbi:MAG: hypothetical protein HY690_20135 [Chloroflexi bacterium]|nr:hypothetical protein [Chloroflexota bacterium]
MAERRDLERLFRPRSTRWRPSAGWILAIALPTVGLILLIQWSMREVKIDPQNWFVALVGVGLTLSAMLGVAVTLFLLALAWLRR